MTEMDHARALATELERLAALLRIEEDRKPAYPKDLVLKSLEWQHQQNLAAVERIYA